MELLKNKFRLLPVQQLIFGFASVILFGAFLLTLPISSLRAQNVPFLDALFTAASAVCVTGLTTLDTGTTYTIFGQLVIIALIQIGGLGIMTITTSVFLIFGKRITLKERMVLQEQYNMDNMQGMVKLTLSVLRATLIIEACGAIVLSARFVPIYGWGKGIYFGIWHSISAFCNAGFDLFGGFRSLTIFQKDPVIILTIAFLIIFGGLGFAVIRDIYNYRKNKKLMLQTKLVVMITAFLLILGTMFFAYAEWNNPRTLNTGNLDMPGKWMNAFFQSLTPRTAGFATVDNGALSMSSKLCTMILMFIGASPGSTGGGIKTTTFLLIMLFISTTFRGKSDYTIFKKRIPSRLIIRALTITLLAAMVIIIGTMSIMFFEHANPAMEHFGFEDFFFEVFSAFGTVGLSAGITPFISAGSKLVLIVIMFIGRLGPLTITLAIANKALESKEVYHYPETRIMIG